MASFFRVTWSRVALVTWTVMLAASLVAVPVKGQPANASQSSVEALQIYEGAANAQNQKAFDLAAEEWTNFLKKFPKDPLASKARYYLGVCQLQQKQWEPAIKSFTEVIAADTKLEMLEDAYLNLGWCQYSAAENGKKELYPEAVNTFTKLLDKFPEGKHRDEALFFRGESLYVQDKKAEAVESYRRLVEDFPESRLRCDALYALGVALEETQQYAEAGTVYDQFLSGCAESPLATEVRMRKAETLLQTESVEEAEQLFGEVAATPNFGSADYALLRQAFARARLDRFDAAAELYTQLSQQFPNSQYVGEAELAAGRAYYRAKNYAAATQWLETARKRGAATGLEAAHWLVRVKLAEGQPAEAERIASEQLDTAGEGPYRIELMMDLADAYYEQPAKRAGSLPLYAEIAEQHPKHRLASQALYNAAFAALELKDFEQARELAARFAANYPEDDLAADAQFVSVEAALLQRDFATAIRELEQLIEQYPERPDRDAWRVRMGTAAYLSGDYAGAIARLEPLIRELETPEVLAEAHYLIGASHFFQDQLEPAAAALQQSLDTSANWRQAEEVMLLLARCRQKQNQWDVAEKLVRELLAKYPNSALRDQAHYRLGEILYGAGRFADAMAAYQQVITTNPASAFAPFALYGIGWSQLKLSQYPDAASTFVSLVNDHPAHELADDALLASGMARRQAGQFPEAIADLNKYLATEPPQPQKSDALYERALAEVAVKDFAAAIATLTAALEENPTYANADKMRYELSWAYRSAGDAAKALAEFSRLAAEHPQSPLAAEAHFHVGEHLYEQQKYNEAATAYTAAKDNTSLSELKEKAAYKLGWSYYQLKDYEKAQAIFAEQTAAFPDGVLHADAVVMQAESLFHREQFAEALAAYQKARDVKPSSDRMAALVLLHGAQSASQLKQWDQSLESLNRLIEQFPDSVYRAEAHYELGWANQNQSRFDEAIKAYEIAAEQRNAVGARARFMMGEVRFAEKNYEAAIRDFQRVMYLYGGEKAPAAIRNWQAKAAFEAGRCAEVQIESAPNAERKAAALANAKKFYSFVAQQHGDHELAAEAQKRMAALAKL